MSNVIKAYSVRYDDEAKKTIDTHLRIDKELEEKKNTIFKTFISQPEGFVEGLMATVVETLPSPEEIQEQSSKALEEAQKEAKQILEQARKEAEQIKKDALTAAQKKGYDEGMLQARKEAQKLKADYDEKTRQLQAEHEAMEPQMVQLIAALVEKITGIIVKDNDDVIFYLVSKAIKNMDKSDEYTIKVSKEDYDYVSERKNLLLGAMERDVSLYITDDMNLKKNQCLIETELKVINCSLDVQLNNLITDLKLMGGI